MTQAQQDLTFLSGVNAEYIAHLYGEFLSGTTQVDQSWQDFFVSLNDDEADLLKELSGASWTPSENTKISRSFGAPSTSVANDEALEVVPGKRRSGDMLSQEDVRRATVDSVSALMLIRSFRQRGHFMADLDPLGMMKMDEHPELDPAFYGFTPADYDRPIFIKGVMGMQQATLREIMKALKETYCGKIGVEFMHLSDPVERKWIQDRIEEPHNKTEFTVNGKRAILQRLTAAESFEKYLHKKYPGTKRFGIDGGESLIPALEQIMKRGGQLGLEEIVIGMSHRGRLNVLANVMGKSFTAIFAEFQGNAASDVLGSGDVKYHLGTSSDRDFDGNTIHLSLTANPSHLEFVNPVVIGKVRAKQIQRGLTEASSVLPLLLHGDAAFAGQGITAETLMISELSGYRVGGTIHIVVNNQIGFTTMPKHSRSGPYSTDVAKMLAAPIFHVNGDDPESVVHVSRIATEFRQKFKKDVVIDIFCYRRYGHNEGDEPAFTQPLMYKKIAKHKTTREIYAENLAAENVLTKEETDQINTEFNDYLEEAYEGTKDYEAKSADFLDGAWKGLSLAHGNDRRGRTAIGEKKLKELGRVLTTIPEGFHIHPKLKRIVEAKAKMFESREGFDWATGEALAFGALLKEDFAVRLSGQDCGRGTFSQRHGIWYDQENETKHIPLKNISENQPRLEILDSPLSEMAVLGFEYGHSLADPKTMVIWEAQFGDFANGAQVIIDQFISSGESKWLRMSGLVLLLPHGFEGQGPEHSSARLERFLQLSAEDNWQICNCTTPASYFHVLRRQMLRDFRKPLVVMTPKSLLRHKLAVSAADDFTGESTFHRVLWDDDRDTLAAPEKIKRVVLCTGKVYYDLLQERRERGIKDVTIIRLEQIFPFPGEVLAAELKPYKKAEIVWCQEEPRNQGAWTFVDPLIEALMGQRAKYAGRTDASAPATGMLSRHVVEQNKLVDEALSVK